MVPDIDIQDLPTPVQIVAVDLGSGARVVLRKGSLRLAIQASMSIPGIFPAVRFDGRWLGDIGVYQSVPCDIPLDQNGLRCGAEGLIAIDVGRQPDHCDENGSVVEMILRCQRFAEQTIRQQSLAQADTVIRPKVHADWFDFSVFDGYRQRWL